MDFENSSRYSDAKLESDFCPWATGVRSTARMMLSNSSSVKGFANVAWAFRWQIVARS